MKPLYIVAPIMVAQFIIILVMFISQHTTTDPVKVNACMSARLKYVDGCLGNIDSIHLVNKPNTTEAQVQCINVIMNTDCE